VLVTDHGKFFKRNDLSHVWS